MLRQGPPTYSWCLRVWCLRASCREPPLQWSRAGKKETKGGRETDRNGEKQGEREREKAKLRKREQPSNSSPSPQHDCRAVRLGIKTLASLHPTQTAALQKHSVSDFYIHMTGNIPHQEKKTFKQTPKLERQREQTQKAHWSPAPFQLPSANDCSDIFMIWHCFVFFNKMGKSPFAN